MRNHLFGTLTLLAALGACTGQSDPATTPTTPAEAASATTAAPVAEQNPAAATTAPGGEAYSTDSLQYLAHDTFELVEYQVSADTLQLVSTSSFLFYPLGQSATLPAFQKQHPQWTFQKEKDPADASVVLYRGNWQGNSLKLFADDEKHTLEIVAGRLTTPAAKLTNGVAVGMDKRAFFAKILKKPSVVESRSRVVEFISGLNGIRHYYTFQGNQLASIVFDSDYQFSKQ